MALNERVFWLDTVTMPPSQGLLSVPERADVAIIGAGYTGLAAGRALASQGIAVVVLEAEAPGWGASSRNGGMVLPGLKLSPGQLLESYGRAAARRIFQASVSSIDCLEQIVREERID